MFRKCIRLVSALIFTFLCLGIVACSEESGGLKDKTSGYLITIPDGMAK